MPDYNPANELWWGAERRNTCPGLGLWKSWKNFRQPLAKLHVIVKLTSLIYVGFLPI